MSYSKSLADRRGLSTEARIALEEVYRRFFIFLGNPTGLVPEEQVASVAESFEYMLQLLWKFPLDRKFHRYGFSMEGCTCPKLDNMERVGNTESRVYSMNCPFHRAFDQ